MLVQHICMRLKLVTFMYEISVTINIEDLLIHAGSAGVLVQFRCYQLISLELS